MLTTCLVQRIDRIAPPASRWASPYTFSSSRSAGTPWLISPIRSASAAVIRSPVNKYSLARAKPMSWGQISAPPSPATRPAMTCGSPILAWSAAMIMSQSSATVAPRADRMAIDPRDDRLVAFQHAEDDPPRLGHTGLPRGRIVDLLLHGDHVPAGRERPARPGQHDDVHVGIVVHVVPDAGHRGVHRPGERVEGLGRVQGYGEHLVLSRHQYTAILGDRIPGSPITDTTRGRSARWPAIS